MMVGKLSKRELEMVAIIFQNLWLRKNSFVFDNILDSLKKMLRVEGKQLEVFLAIAIPDGGEGV